MGRAEGPALVGLPVAASLLAGVVLAQALPSLPPWPWLLPPALLAFALACSNGASRWPGVLLLGLLLAALHGRWALDQRLPGHLAGRDLAVDVRVEGLPWSDHDSLRFDGRVLATDKDGEALVGKRVRLSWYRNTERPAAGSTWRLAARFKAPRGVLNPGGHDLEQRALEQGIVATGYVLDAGPPRRLAPGQGLDHWRESLSSRIAESLPEGRGRFVQALGLGDTRGLVGHDWEVLRTTGLTHLIAISGFHVGLVAGFGALLGQGLYRCLPRLGRRLPRPQGCAALALASAAGYTALAGFALPTVRTLLMIAVVAIARGVRRPTRGQDAFALSLVAVLLADPLAILTPGFWLSFVGVAWLLWCLPAERQAGLLGPFLKAQGVAVLGLLPLTVWFFGQASLPGPLVNLVGIPLISLVVVPLSLLGLLALPTSPSAADGLWRSAAWIMDWFWRGLEAVAAWPPALVWLPEPGVLALALAMIGAFWLMLPRVVPGKVLAALLFLPLLWPRLDRPGQGQADILVLDVGQGLSVLVRTQGHALLYDAGPAPPHGLDLGEAAVVPALRALGLRRLDRLLLSHGDNDHAGGADAVRAAFPGATLMAPQALGLDAMSCESGGSWHWDGVRFDILHPPPLFPYLRNDSSCVLRIEAGGRVALLPGDIGRQVERRLVREAGGALRADLLVASHHGSNSSSDGDFIEAVAPSLVLFAVGHGNRFRLPKQDVVTRFREAGASLADSAGSGAIRVRLGAGVAPVPRLLRRDQPRYWRHAAPTGTGYAIGSSRQGR